MTASNASTKLIIAAGVVGSLVVLALSYLWTAAPLSVVWREDPEGVTARAADVLPSSPAAGSKLSGADEPKRSKLQPQLELRAGDLPWERRVDQVLHSSGSDATKAQRLFQLLAELPEEALFSTAETAAGLLPNSDYRFAEQILLSPTTHPQALIPLFADLLGRPDRITLPALLKIARSPQHPFSTSAGENLRLLLDHHEDFAAKVWDEAIDNAVADPARQDGFR
jgi:hypothetical protein